MVTAQLIEFKTAVDQFINKKKMKKDDAIFNVLRETIATIKPELSIENLKEEEQTPSSTPSQLTSYTQAASVELFEGLSIFSKRELEARLLVDLEAYISTIQIESRTLGDMARNHIIPTAIRYQNILIENIQGLKEIYGTGFKKYASEQLILLESISNYIAQINEGVTKMIAARKKGNQLTDFHKRALHYESEVKPFLTSIRYQCDKLELTVEDSLWPLAKYRELLFVR